ncbi:xanthine dehydrogenase family protein molybdopterin-binding subunit [Sphingomonas sp. LB2R24]
MRATNADRVVRLGDPLSRIDGPLKVCGTAEFPGDVPVGGLAYGALVLSPIAKGQIDGISRDAALGCPDVLMILTHEDVGEAIRHVEHVMEGGWANSSWRPLSSPEIRYAGQIVGLVVAETLEAAREGAAALDVTYRAEPPVTSLGDPRSDVQPLSSVRHGFLDRRKGNLDEALIEATACIDEFYTTPVQHHNPIELPSTTCRWDGDHLTVYEPTRFVSAAQHGLAAQLDLDPAKVRIVSPFIGGHFGAKLALSQHTAICALAARRLQRTVRLDVNRADQFSIANHRTETSHRIRLAADCEGRLRGVGHAADVVSSRFDAFAMEGTDVSTALYAADAIVAEERLGRVDRNTPGPMRAPPEVPYLFAIESALDELAHTLDMDPVDLRRRNEAQVDPVTGKPFTTRPMMRCFDAAAEAFGWSARRRRPRTALCDGWWVGYGCAAAARPVKTGPVAIRLVRSETGAVRVETGHHEIGNGLYTLLAAVASERLCVPLDAVTVSLGDTDLPAAGISGGSSTTTSLVHALAQACAELLMMPVGAREVYLEYVPPGSDAGTQAALRTGHMKLSSASEEKLAWTFGAHMVEVRVNSVSGEVRVARHVGAFAAGRVLNPVAARGQFLGGMIWGQGSALFEKTEIDERTGAYINRDLGEYLVPTAADVGELEAIVVADDDTEVNREGVKGLGEIGIIGVNAAIANAVFNATGIRVRDLPIRLESLLGPV